MSAPACFRPSFTALHIELLIHYHTTPAPHPRAHAPAVAEYTQHLVKLGLIEYQEGPGLHGYTTTPMGMAHVRALCTLPLPEQRWVTPAQDERTV